MSYSFTKLYSSILGSTVWFESDRVVRVWITMLADADRNGRVWASVPGLAYRARVPEEDAEIALIKFLSPDPKSRSQEFEGRRIEKVDGGWQLLNYSKYREMRDGSERREYIRGKVAKFRKNPILPESKIVMQELHFEDRTLARKIDDALKSYAGMTGKSHPEVAQKMIDAYRAYLNYANDEQLRFLWAPRKFFSQGHWTAAASWPIKTPQQRQF